MSSLYYKCSLVSFCLFISLQGSGQTYVDVSNGINGDGSTWANAYNNLENALSSASSGDEIWVAEGTYSLTTTTSEFNIPSGVALYGGFEGDETARNQRSWSANPTILDGANTAYNVVFMQNVNSNTILDGFTIQNGNANGPGDVTNKAGGGLFVQLLGTEVCNPTIANCIFQNNFADQGGGAIYLYGPNSGLLSPIIADCRFENNTANNDGGAVYVNASAGGNSLAQFTKCIFKSNSSTSGSGGALFINANSGGNTLMDITQCDFDGNSANLPGGAIYNSGSSGGNADPTISDCRFYDNTALSGAGIYNNGSGTNSQSDPTITNCTFYNNRAVQNGGAIYNNGENGGQCETTINNCIIYGNTAPFNGSEVMRNVSASPTIRYSLVDVADCNGLADANNGNSTITCGNGMIYNQDPMFENATLGNFRLAAGSPAIDAGNNGLNFNTEDLEGNDRKVMDIDMGAYENEEGSLPIELADFRANLENARVKISWITISETNNDFFVVERSGNGRDFEALEIVQGAGNTTTAHSYQIYDYNPLPGKNYYRLKDVSYTGEVAYSSVRIVETAKQKIKIYPNPSADYIQINLNDFPSGDAKIDIYNSKGQLMYAQKLKLEDGRRMITIDAIQALIPGSYFINISAAKTKTWNARFEKIGTR